MKIHLLQAEHFSVPGILTKAFASHGAAVDAAIELTNDMLADNGDTPDAGLGNWTDCVERLQDEHGAAHCYVEIEAIDVNGAVSDPVADALRRAESFIAGFEDDDTQDVTGLLADIRVTLAGAPADPVREAAPDMLAFVRSVAEGAAVEGRWLSATGEAIDGYDTEDDEPPADEWPDATWEPYTEEEQAQYLYGIASQARALIAKAEGRTS